MIPKTLYTGKHLIFQEKYDWEYVIRPNVTGVVGILAYTDNDEFVVIDQYRIPVEKRVIEIPCGLVGDLGKESLENAAQRELVEESGFEAGKFEKLFECPAAQGLTSEIITVFRATELTKVSEGGGDETEDINVTIVLACEFEQWMKLKIEEGYLVDSRVLCYPYYWKSK